MATVIELNGAVITGRIEGVEELKITMRRKDDDNRAVTSYSSELTFYDDGWDLISAELIEDPNGFTNQVEVKIYDDCCRSKVFTGFIRGDAIDWCEPGCSVTCNVIEDDEALTCVKSTVIWDNHNNFLTKQHPSMRYCLELRPNFIQYIVIALSFVLITLMYAIMIPLIAIIFVIFGIIYVICLVIVGICFLIGCDPPDCNEGFTNPINVINDILEVFDFITDTIVGCGRFHPSPLLRDYITNVCDKCNLTFQSSIINNASSIYYNTVLFNAEVEKGRKNDSTDYTLIDGNKPLLTLEQLLDEFLNMEFNAEWRIVNGVLIFERKDFFAGLSVWVSAATLLDQGRLIDGHICYTWQDKQRPSFLRAEYQPDAQEYIGNEAKPRTDQLVEWNSPYSPMQSGELNKQFPFGAARFRDDGIEKDVYSFFADFLGGIFDALFGGAFSESRKYMLMNQHTAFNMKLMIWDTTSISEGIVKNDYSNSFAGGNVEDNEGNIIPPEERFNYPYWVKSENQNNLYDFHAIDNPRLPGATQFDFDFAFNFNCSEYESFSFDKTVQLIKGGALINGIPQEVEIDFKTKTMIVKGIV